MSGWILTKAEWTGTGVDSSDNAIAIIDACKNALLLNSCGSTTNKKWILDSTEGFTDRQVFGSGNTLSYGYYFVHSGTGAKLCMICTYKSNPFATNSYCYSLPFGSSSGATSPPFGLCFAMIPPNDTGITWGSADWTTATWLPDIGIRLTGLACNGTDTTIHPLAESNTESVVYTYYFLCKSDTIFAMSRASDWKKPWEANSCEHTRSMIIGEIFESFDKHPEIPWHNYGALSGGCNTYNCSPKGTESKQSLSTSNERAIIFRKYTNDPSWDNICYNSAYGSGHLYWQCFNNMGVLCISRGNGTSSSPTGRSPDIKTYNGDGIVPMLGYNLYYASLSHSMYHTAGQFHSMPIVMALHRSNSNTLNDNYPGISGTTGDSSGLKGYIRTDLLLSWTSYGIASHNLATGQTCNNQAYICPCDGVLLGWDASNENIFANPNP